ncbi:MAG: fused MFS/spermidine synthase [Magnetococcales bacterium]|nr:fused MFS/spermidine synthase [Magnetococcales bacterium]
MTRNRSLLWFFAGTIFTSAFLLFLVQPIIAKQILPWFGGSAMVWTLCMVFFQSVLLVGYAYSDWITSHLAPINQGRLHGAIIVASLLSLPIVVGVDWKPHPTDDPAYLILGLLLVTIGLPYFLLSTTGPLLQSWCALTIQNATVYRLFSLSNLASLLALVSYPFFIEPWFSTLVQAISWSWVYTLFVILSVVSIFFFTHHPCCTEGIGSKENELKGEKPTVKMLFMWLSLAGMGSWLLVAITNHITQNIASVPFFWILPLGLYLLTFVLCFERKGWYDRRRYALPLVLILVISAWGLQDGRILYNLYWAVPLYLGALFLLCMFLHGELASRRPALGYLTRFYLMLSLGGALGGVLAGVVAPWIFSSFYELGIAFVLIGLLAALVMRSLGQSAMVAALVVMMACGWFFYRQVEVGYASSRVLMRNFYGTLRVLERTTPESGLVVRSLIHGTIKHGEQFMANEKSGLPTTYFGHSSGIGLMLDRLVSQPKPIKLGVIGLGIGTLATYGRVGDTIRFYEINPQVLELAQREFRFLGESRAKIEISMGDARLSLEREEPQGFDVLVVDAFSSDAIPVHLITREALAIYRTHLKPMGVVAYHVSNRYLDLAPVVKMLAEDAGMGVVSVVDFREDINFSLNTTHWVLVSRDRELLQSEEFRKSAMEIKEIPGMKLWTNDFNNLFQVLK